ncbi:PIN domain-containing protein [Orrella marina]|nr:PIN domain-containing protein [Orrella marina]
MSGVLRPLLLSLARDGWFTPLWSDKISNEWKRNAVRIWPVDPEKLDQAWLDMETAHPHANLSSPANTRPDWKPPPLRYSDAKDWHVIHTACLGRTVHPEVSILTWNLKDFQKTELKRLGIGVLDPDKLLSQWWQRNQAHLAHRLQETVDELIHQGRRQPEPLQAFLKRERLYRLSRLAQSK